MLKKKIGLFVSVLTGITIVGTAFFFAFAYTVAEDYAYAVKDSLVGNAVNLPPYYRLDGGFRSEVSEEEYGSAETADEFLSLFEKINAIDRAPDLFQRLSLNSTDQGKKEAAGIIEAADGTTYLVHHHIAVASSLFFEPVIVSRRIDITECSPNTAFP